MNHPHDALDQLTSVLARTRPALDDAMDARLQARLTAALASPPSIPRSPRSYRPAIALAAAAALLALLLLVLRLAPSSSALPSASPQANATPPSLRDRAGLRLAALAWLRAALDAADPSARAEAAVALVTLEDREARPALQKMAALDPEAIVRVQLNEALARRGDADAHGRLLLLMRSRERASVYQAELALSSLALPGDPAAIARLQARLPGEMQLLHAEPRAEAQLLTALTRLRDPLSRKRLLALLDSPDPLRRLAAAEGLASLGHDAGAEVLASAAAQPPHRLAAILALQSIGRPTPRGFLVEQLQAKDAVARRRAARALGQRGDAEALPALRDLAHRDPDATARVAAAFAILRLLDLERDALAARAGRLLRDALASADLSQREAAAGSLADLPDEAAALELLARSLGDSSPDVRIAAAGSARRMDSAPAALALVAALAIEADPRVRAQHVRALAQLGRREAHPILTKLSAEPGPSRALAAGALLATGDPSKRALLEHALASPQLEQRLTAVRALALAPSSTTALLERALFDRALAVRLIAAEELASLRSNHPRVAHILDEGLQSKDLDSLRRALAALARSGERRADVLLSTQRMIHSANADLRLAAVSITGALAAADALPLLRQLLVDPAPLVRRAALDLIADLDDLSPGEALALYRARADDPDPLLRAKAAGQLARLLPASRSP